MFTEFSVKLCQEPNHHNPLLNGGCCLWALKYFGRRGLPLLLDVAVVLHEVDEEDFSAVHVFLTNTELFRRKIVYDVTGKHDLEQVCEGVEQFLGVAIDYYTLNSHKDLLNLYFTIEWREEGKNFAKQHFNLI